MVAMDSGRGDGLPSAKTGDLTGRWGVCGIATVEDRNLPAFETKTWVFRTIR